jgi:hypothetical protein
MQQVGKTGEPPGAKAPAARLCSSRVDWPAQPSLNLAQNYFSRISWIVSIVLCPITGLLDDSPGARKREPAHDRLMPDATGATFDHPLRRRLEAGPRVAAAATRVSRPAPANSFPWEQVRSPPTVGFSA